MKFKIPVKWRIIYLMRVNNLAKEQLIFRAKCSKMSIIQHRKYRCIVARNCWVREILRNKKPAFFRLQALKKGDRLRNPIAH